MAKMYKKDGQTKTLADWMKQVNQYALILTFQDGSQRKTTTLAYSPEQAAFHGMYMNFGQGLPVKSVVLSSLPMSVRKFKANKYVPANIGLIEVEQG